MNANKPRLLELKFISRLEEIKRDVPLASKREYIPFPLVFEKICRCFSMKKSDVWTVLIDFKKKNYLEIVRFHGIKLNYQITNVTKT